MAGRVWTNEEIQFLKDNYQQMSCEEIAPHINRTRRATQHMFGMLGLERPQPQIGDTINRLTIIEKYEKKVGKQNKTVAICQCICDKKLVKHILLSSIVAGKIQSCGCIRDEKVRDRIILMNKTDESSIRSHKRFFQGYEEIHKSYICELKHGATFRNLQFDISIEFLWSLFMNQKRKCKLTGLHISFPKLLKDEQTASVDRINSKIGYIESNIQWVHKHINSMKQDFDQQYFINTCKLITNPVIYEDYTYKSEYINHNANWKGFGDISLTFWNSIVSGAKSRKLDFEINIEDGWNLFIKQNGLCGLSGQRLSFGTKFGKDSANQSASLDRIDSSKGYTLDNIQWVHKDINKMKQSFNNDYFKELCRLIAINN